jgi:hypothetical protein
MAKSRDLPPGTARNALCTSLSPPAAATTLTINYPAKKFLAVPLFDFRDIALGFLSGYIRFT